ncbi:MAG TPA: ABC transporter permease, partial [Helicobacteraceae bacterium]|nr:ABC transporter permease [Helicobacteraceae bacterium]
MRFIEVLILETKAVFSDIAIVLTIIGGVILYAFLYPQPYVNEAVSELSVAVIDSDNSDVTRRLKFMLEATPQIKITNEVQGLEDAKELLRRDKIKGIIIFKKDFTHDIYLHKQPTVAIAADASYFLILGAILEGASKTV